MGNFSTSSGHYNLLFTIREIFIKYCFIGGNSGIFPFIHIILSDKHLILKQVGLLQHEGIFTCARPHTQNRKCLTRHIYYCLPGVFVLFYSNDGAKSIINNRYSNKHHETKYVLQKCANYANLRSCRYTVEVIKLQ